ncbi:MAG: sigma-70 family RNA polymerase sigma factor [Bacteroidota bacterium]|jgi:RNA polymerase sigma factor (sigma-70 family)
MRTEKFLSLFDLYVNGNLKERFSAENELYRGFYNMGVNILNKKRFNIDEVSLEECLNTSILKVFNNYEGYNPNYAPSTWFETILGNEVRDRIRFEKRRGKGKKDSIDSFYKSEEDENNSLDLADDFYCPSIEIDRLVLRKILDKLMMELNEMQRRILRLHLEGKSNTEIVAITGRDKSYVGTNLFRAINKLKEINNNPTC